MSRKQLRQPVHQGVPRMQQGIMYRVPHLEEDSSGLKYLTQLWKLHLKSGQYIFFLLVLTCTPVSSFFDTQGRIQGLKYILISMWIFYLHSVIESVRGNRSIALCCSSGVKKDRILFSRDQTEVFFLGLPMHQVFAIITFVYGQ